jgi:hypothetical protein
VGVIGHKNQVVGVVRHQANEAWNVQEKRLEDGLYMQQENTVKRPTEENHPPMIKYAQHRDQFLSVTVRYCTGLTARG